MIAGATLFAPAIAPAQAAEGGARAPAIVIGHRGAPAYVPEHTLASYLRAIEQGADFIEPDLVATRDGVLIARHEPYLGGDHADMLGADSTDVARHPQFANRKKTVVLDGMRLTGWFAEDFTLAEIRTLRANERLPALRRWSAASDGLHGIPTLADIVALVQRVEATTGRRVGLYIETKHPSYHAGIGLPLEDALVRTLTETGFTDARRVFIQSFEVGNLQRLDGLLEQAGLALPLVQLFSNSGKPWDFEVAGDARTWDDLATPTGLAFIATYADGIGPNKARVLRASGPASAEVTSLVDDAHALGLVVHPYTFRSENAFLPPELRKGEDPSGLGDHASEYALFLATGIDGLFSDNPDHAVEARDGAAAARRTAQDSSR
jgi:glycerophosphoryl diester phosphodiesterase